MSTHSKYKMSAHVMYTNQEGQKLGTISEILTAVSKTGLMVTYTMGNGDQVLESQVTGEVSIKKPRASRARKTLNTNGLANGSTHAEPTTEATT